VKHRKVLLLGGSGFVGQSVAAQLVRLGYRVIVPTRYVERAKNLWVLPGVQCVQSDIHRMEDLVELCSQLNKDDVVINLVGILHDRPKFPYGKLFEKNHVALPKKIIAAMKACGLNRYIHMSALGASSSGPSMYQRSKGDGEALVKSSGLDWTIFRPSVIFGLDDQFINLFASLQKYTPVLPLAGAAARFQPVAVSDVAQAFTSAIGMSSTFQQSYDLCGQKTYSLKELVILAGKKGGRQSWIIPIPECIGYVQAFLLEHLPGPTLMSRDNISSMKVDNVLPPCANNSLEDVFGISPKTIESLLQ
jgi:NADH dehydrogenase